MKCTSFMYKSSNWLLSYYFWWIKSWSPPSFTPHCLTQFIKSSKSRHNSSWFIVAVSSQIPHFNSCIVCGQFVCKRSFKYPPTKRCRTVRSGDLTDHGISDTWKCSSSVISTLHTPPIYCHWKGLEMAWHLFLGVQTLPLPPSWGKSAFWSVSIGSEPRCTNSCLHDAVVLWTTLRPWKEAPYVVMTAVCALLPAVQFSSKPLGIIHISPKRLLLSQFIMCLSLPTIMWLESLDEWMGMKGSKMEEEG